MIVKTLINVKVAENVVVAQMWYNHTIVLTVRIVRFVNIASTAKFVVIASNVLIVKMFLNQNTASTAIIVTTAITANIVVVVKDWIMKSIKLMASVLNQKNMRRKNKYFWTSKNEPIKDWMNVKLFIFFYIISLTNVYHL